MANPEHRRRITSLGRSTAALDQQCSRLARVTRATSRTTRAITTLGEARAHFELQLVDVAQLIGVHWTTIMRWEDGVSTPRTVQLALIERFVRLANRTNGRHLIIEARTQLPRDPLAGLRLLLAVPMV
jgi:DNA-binding transcriptional regulator YiaG